MDLHPLAHAFFKKTVSDAQLLEALGAYEGSRNIPFRLLEEGLVGADGKGWSLQLRCERRLRSVIEQVRACGRDDAKGSVMFVDVRFGMDDEAYEGTVYGARAPFGETIATTTWEGLATCEALNIQLHTFKPLIRDLRTGWYPKVW